MNIAYFGGYPHLAAADERMVEAVSRGSPKVMPGLAAAALAARDEVGCRIKKDNLAVRLYAEHSRESILVPSTQSSCGSYVSINSPSASASS